MTPAARCVCVDLILELAARVEQHGEGSHG